MTVGVQWKECKFDPALDLKDVSSAFHGKVISNQTKQLVTTHS